MEVTGDNFAQDYVGTQALSSHGSVILSSQSPLLPAVDGKEEVWGMGGFIRQVGSRPGTMHVTSIPPTPPGQKWGLPQPSGRPENRFWWAQSSSALAHVISFPPSLGYAERWYQVHSPPMSTSTSAASESDLHYIHGVHHSYFCQSEGKATITHCCLNSHVLITRYVEQFQFHIYLLSVCFSSLSLMS